MLFALVLGLGSVADALLLMLRNVLFSFPTKLPQHEGARLAVRVQQLAVGVVLWHHTGGEHLRISLPLKSSNKLVSEGRSRVRRISVRPRPGLFLPHGRERVAHDGDTVPHLLAEVVVELLREAVPPERQSSVHLLEVVVVVLEAGQEAAGPA